MRRTIEQVFDDLTNEPIEDGEARTVRLVVGNLERSLDLSPDSYDKFMEEMDPWLGAGTPVKAQRRGPRPGSSLTIGMSKEQRQAIRDWANNNGYEVSERGRISAEIVEAFNAAH